MTHSFALRLKSDRIDRLLSWIWCESCCFLLSPLNDRHQEELLEERPSILTLDLWTSNRILCVDLDKELEGETHSFHSEIKQTTLIFRDTLLIPFDFFLHWIHSYQWLSHQTLCHLHMQSEERSRCYNCRELTNLTSPSVWSIYSSQRETPTCTLNMWLTSGNQLDQRCNQKRHQIKCCSAKLILEVRWLLHNKVSVLIIALSWEEKGHILQIINKIFELSVFFNFLKLLPRFLLLLKLSPILLNYGACNSVISCQVSSLCPLQQIWNPSYDRKDFGNRHNCYPKCEYTFCTATVSVSLLDSLLELLDTSALVVEDGNKIFWRWWLLFSLSLSSSLKDSITFWFRLSLMLLLARVVEQTNLSSWLQEDPRNGSCLYILRLWFLLSFSILFPSPESKSEKRLCLLYKPFRLQSWNSVERINQQRFSHKSFSLSLSLGR